MEKIGVGIGLSFYGTGYGNGFPDVSRCIYRLLEDGRVGVYVGATEVGQGAKTALAQIAAEALGIGLSQIDFVNEDTSRMPDSGTAAASRKTYNTGNALRLGSEKFKEVLAQAAMKELGLNSTVGLGFKDGFIYLETLTSKRISFKELGLRYRKDILQAQASFTAQTVEMDPETGQGAPYWPYTFNACIVKVSVDEKTGLVDLLDGSFAQDVGRAVNPKLVEGQMDGGFAMGLGYTIFEDLDIRDGKIYSNKFSKYLMPTAMDMIDIENIIVEDPEETSPYGAKGIGEPVLIPIGPAILNAIYDATGVRMKDLPVSPEKLAKEIERVRNNGFN